MNNQRNGERIGQYELCGLLGEGGNGQVYVARDTVLGRLVAIKTLRPEYARDHNFVERFAAEARSLANLSHPNITTLYGFEATGPTPYMAMELVPGHTLEALLARVNQLPLRASLAVTAQAAAGLAYAHGEGVIHRDIKPGNLMITTRGQLKIMDFGIARVTGSKRLTRAGQIFGTLLYASPEQIRGGEVDQRSDLYSLGVVFYEMLAGVPPFTSENEHALMTAHLEMPPPELSGRVAGLSSELDAVILRALAKSPEDRFPSVESFARAAGTAAVRGEETEILQQLVVTAFRNQPPPATRFVATADRNRSQGGGPGSRDQRRSGPEAERRPRSSLRGPAIALAAAAAGLGLGIGYMVLTSTPPPTPPPSRVAIAEPPAPATPTAPAATFAVKPSGPSTVMIEVPKPEPTKLATPPAPQPPAPQPPAQPSTGPLAALPMPVPPVAPPPTPAPQPEPPLETAPAPATALGQGRPDLAGTVRHFTGASTFMISGHKDPIDLCGITDPTRHGEHSSTIYNYLAPYNGAIECYKKTNACYQCFAGGHDLAVLAIRYGLVRLTAHAPQEYRELVSDRHR